MKRIQMEDNKKFIQMVLDQDQSYNAAQKEKKKLMFMKQKELMRFQRLQAGELVDPEDDTSQSAMKATSIGTKAIAARRLKPVGGPMQIEEIRMNKGLLKEISKMKKDQIHTDRGENTSPLDFYGQAPFDKN